LFFTGTKLCIKVLQARTDAIYPRIKSFRRIDASEWAVRLAAGWLVEVEKGVQNVVSVVRKLIEEARIDRGSGSGVLAVTLIRGWHTR
jgi:hypothetical protein